MSLALVFTISVQAQDINWLGSLSVTSYDNEILYGAELNFALVRDKYKRQKRLITPYFGYMFARTYNFSESYKDFVRGAFKLDLLINKHNPIFFGIGGVYSDHELGLEGILNVRTSPYHFIGLEVGILSTSQTKTWIGINTTWSLEER